jgi:hypothetical protein
LRRVVGIEREQDVLQIRDRKFAAAQRAESAKETQDDEDGTDGDDEGDSSNETKKGRIHQQNVKDRHKKDKAFNYYQAALTEVIVNLSEEEVEEMQDLANAWNEHGPPPETRRRYMDLTLLVAADFNIQLIAH